MSSLARRFTLLPSSAFCACSLVALVLILALGSYRSSAQEAKRTGQPTASPVARGQYIVEDVAMCGTCHTPRRPNGEIDRSRWLAGAPVPYLSAQPASDWPIVAPRLAGNPPTSDAGMITLLTTGIWITGQQLRDPMPKFHMTPSDAEAVVAYLRSLSPRP
jgi:mono/diheme cytochrome c family protein